MILLFAANTNIANIDFDIRREYEYFANISRIREYFANIHFANTNISRILANIRENCENFRENFREYDNIGEYSRIRVFAANTSDIRGDIRRPRKPTIRREYANIRGTPTYYLEPFFRP